MDGQLVKDREPRIMRDSGKRFPITVLDNSMFTIEINKKLLTEFNSLQLHIKQSNIDGMIRDIANLQLCLKHLCEAWNIPEKAVEHIYSLMINELGGYDARIFQMVSNPKIPVGPVQENTADISSVG